MINLNPPRPAQAIKDWLTLEVTKDGGFTQAAGTTISRSTLKPGDLVELGLPYCKRLIVQSVNRSRVTMGCWLSVYLSASPAEPEKKLSRQLGGVLQGMLVARGIPLSAIVIESTENTGAIPRVGDDPVEVAAALGYLLYCDAELKVRLAPKIPQGVMVGQFTLAELASYQPGEDGPLSANRVVAKGDLVTVRTAQGQEGTRVRERVTTGWRTVITSSQVKGRQYIERELVLEPPSEISRFSATYEKTTNPNALIAMFTEPLEEPAMRSQETVTTTTRDRDGYIVQRDKVIRGCAAKGISSFYSAWAGASVPKPDQTAVEPDSPPSNLEGPREYNIVGVGGDQINSSQSGGAEGFGDFPASQPMTLLRPSGMFGEIPLLIETETWDYSRNLVTYERNQQLPLGAILPELGNPLGGYQEPTEQSPPVYRDPTTLFPSEHETIKWVKDDLGRWESRRTLSQAIGVRNAQEPRDAMGAVQYGEDAPERYRLDRSNVAVVVATQLKVSSTSLQYSSPPGPSPIEEMQEIETFTPYSVMIELNGNDLLNRTIEISPSPFCANLEGVRKVAEYAALELRGQANTTRMGIPLTALAFDIPPNSVIELAGKKYLAVSMTSRIDSAQGVLEMDLWEL